MPGTRVDRGPIAPSKSELPELERLNRLLEKQQNRELRIVGASGEVISLPESALRALSQTVDALARDGVVVVRRMTRDLTMDEAANLLNVPLDALLRLIESGLLPSRVKGGLRRVCFDDLMDYLRQRDADRQRVLSEIAQESQELAASMK